MSNIVTNAPYRVRWYCDDLVSAQIGVNTVYYLASSVVGTPTTLQVIGAMSADAAAIYKTLMGFSTNYSGASIAQMDEPPANPTRQLMAQDFVNTGNGPGSLTSNTMPGQVSFIIGLKTPFAARNMRGRIYPPFPATSWSDSNGLMLPAGQTALAALATFIKTPYAFNDHAGNSCVMTPCIRSVVKQTPPLLPLVTYTALTNAIARQKFATQRKRGQYGRVNPPPP